MQCNERSKLRRAPVVFATALTVALVPVGAQFAVAPAASALGSGEISGKTWNDTDYDGVQDTWEPGIEGMTVTLIGPDGYGVDTATTDADGNYSFQVFETGEHALQFEGLPERGQFTLQNEGSDDNLDSDASEYSGRTDPFTVESLDSVIDNLDAGVVTDEPIAQPEGAIGDRVWQDKNANGIQDAGEWDMPGVNIELLDSAGTVIARTQSDGNGAYLFDGLDAGRYYVSVQGLRDGWVLSPNNVGSDRERDSNINPSSGRSGVINLTEAGARTGSVDIGVYVRR